MRVHRLLAAAFLLAALVVPAHRPYAAGGTDEASPIGAPLLPGVGSHDPRVRVKVDAPPWRAIGKLQATAGNLYESCTGTLVAPALVLTAAHCVFNLRTQRNFPPEALHFLVGYDAGRYAGHAVGRRIEVGRSYDPHRPAATRGSDWALIALDRPLGAAGRTLTILEEPPAVGSTVMLGGYSQDHPLMLMADTACRVIGRLADSDGRPLLRHDCAGSSGVSGAPLLLERDGHWYVAAIAVAAELGTASGFAVFPDGARRETAAARR